ncbi:hypothetical protein LTR10_019816 [Elasticomyces elasticus]|uniref:NADP-dependent oxidoreductase domain-containing protein n=1 Tax=Exophiala sideris TaxID=1016849 RepID=A0ABR0J1P3_9EURO|nr:hypothetical protein LTR10_019816 [Elasticomyces elasticus]KAK5024400.1 hypothetical protein LTS07_008691 [Exophiala sideris]KAK5030918.1 hypothetical protein LTR13_007931 [Exophiala sideris]KAK5054133.1 hypothetical protein LTR69_009095 [Exophiala sideris]KAK5179511.1 hypothetical protein LTR44_008027 [Eurotiomycetes sp. CCFEE 6388]
MSSQPIKVIYGTANIGNEERWKSSDYVNEAFKIRQTHDVKDLDTAQLFGGSQQKLGELKAGDKFSIDTKWLNGWKPGSGNKDNILSSAKESISKLGVKQVDVFYLHAPDSQTDLEDTLAGVNEVYKLGLFKRFGLSNYPVEDVQKVYDISKKNGPLAGGFLTKTAEQIKEGAGRFGEQKNGGMYRKMYMKESYLAALAKWEDIASEEGVSRAELAYRWVAYNSPLKDGDGLIIGASRTEQLEQTLQGIKKGKLSDKAAKRIDEVWEGIKHEAPLDNFSK